MKKFLGIFGKILLGLFITCCFLVIGIFILSNGCYNISLLENESCYKGKLDVIRQGNRELKQEQNPEIEIDFDDNIVEEFIKEGARLVLKKSFEDHTDYLFFDESLFRFRKIGWGGRIVKFKGVVTAIDGKNGTYYYNVERIIRFKMSSMPNEGLGLRSIEDIIYKRKNLGENESFYNGELSISGVGPEISMEPRVDEGTLVLKGYFEDHSDHIFLPAGSWENYFNEESDYLPGNKVNFEGYVAPLDAAAGNHYYEVVNVDKIELISYPNADEVKNLFEGYNYCEKDSDCGYFVGECPLGCYIPLNVKYIDIASSIVTNFVNHLGDDERCIYGCLLMNKAVCNNYKCEMIDAPAEADVHACGPNDKDPELSCDDTYYDLACGNDGKTYKNDCFACKEPLVETFTFGQCENDSGVKYCTAFQKSADACNMIYAPVCGNDGKTYGNDCVACQSETVESYTMGECKSSAFTVEGDSEYLQEVEDILTKNGGVTCDLFYTDYDRQIHSFFMADNDRFYSAIDDYSDNLQRNVIYTLAIDGKTYNWSTFPDSEKLVIDYPADIESEIASLIMDKGEYPDFEMNCYEGIDVTNEHLFEISPE